MKERPIIFNGDMVRAILSGRKSQTRRVIANVGADNCIPLQKQTKTKDGIYTYVMDAPMYGLCPFGQVGDRLWVREAWNKYCGLITYRADHDWIDEMRQETVCTAKWTPSIHMPRWASRITLEITAVRVERLNDISQEDAQAEGMELTGWIPSCSNPDNAGFDETFTPYDNFAMLWESIYGEESWSANPWVWVIEFKRVEAQHG